MINTYIPLYRKYRPQTFSDLIGQENITQALSNAIKLNKVAHAYLFCGPRGTGKTSSARIFAKSLNCVNGPTVEPCGKCPSCIDITNTTPVDVVEIDAASNRSVEDAQNILEKIQYVPIHGKYKIYIIDEVHMLSAHAFNALLKTLEEPPENVVFILATTEAHKVLETIISRCQRFDFRRITVEDIVKRLEYISEKENINISKDALFAVAKSAKGGMRDALALLDQLSILNIQKQIDVEDVENLLGKISVNVLFELTEKIISNNAQGAVLELNKIYEKGNEPQQIISNYIEYFRNLLIIKTCSDEKTIFDLTQLNQDLIKKLSEQAEKLDTIAINYIIDKLADYLREIKNSTDKYLWLEVCILELANKLSNIGFSDLVGRIEALEKRLTGGIQPEIKREITIQKPEIVKAEPVQAQVKAEPTPAPTLAPAEKPAVSDAEKPETKPAEIQERPMPEKTAEQAQTAAEKQEHEPENTVQQSVQPKETSADGVENWNTILSSITSYPSRMFFTGLATPILLTPQKIIIGFKKEGLIQQYKNSNKPGHLQEAIKTVFGNADMPIEVKYVPESEISKKIDLTAQTKTTPKTAVQEETEINEDDEAYYEQKLTQARETKQPTPPNHSDQAKMVLDLFNGKYMD